MCNTNNSSQLLAIILVCRKRLKNIYLSNASVGFQLFCFCFWLIESNNATLKFLIKRIYIDVRIAVTHTSWCKTSLKNINGIDCDDWPMKKRRRLPLPRWEYASVLRVHIYQNVQSRHYIISTLYAISIVHLQFIYNSDFISINIGNSWDFLLMNFFHIVSV